MITETKYMSRLDILRAAGQELYGKEWRAPISRALQRPGSSRVGIQQRDLHSWLAGDRGVPGWVPMACTELLYTRATSHRELADRLRVYVDC